MASIFDNLIDFLGDSEGQSSEELISELRAEGIGIDNILASVDSLVTSNIEKTKRGWINDAHKLLKQKQAKLNSINIDLPSFDELKDKVRKIISDNPDYANAYFSNFTELSEDDLKAIYIDFKKLKMIDEEQESEDE